MYTVDNVSSDKLLLFCMTMEIIDLINKMIQ